MIGFLGLGLACLRDIDPNPENLVGTGIVKTASSGIGCLLRLEPNEQLQVRKYYNDFCFLALCCSGLVCSYLSNVL